MYIMVLVRIIGVVAPWKGKCMMNENSPTLVNVSPEDESAFLEALQDPEKRKQIISILKEAGLLRE